MIKEPKRLAGESGALGEEIAALRGRLPSTERMAALAERLSAAGASTASPPLDSPLGLVDAKGPTFAKAADSGARLVIVALLAGGALVGGALWWRRPAPAAAVPARPTLEAPPILAGSAPAGVRASELTATVASAPGTTQPALGGTAAALGVAPMGVDATPTSSPPSSTAFTPEPRPAKATVVDSVRSPSAQSAPSAPSARVESESAHAASKATTAHGDAPSTGAALAQNTVVVSEVELLKRARSALAADPVAALSLTEQCRAQYPNGGFAQERDFIAISALLRMGRADEAHSRFSLFKMHYPGSPYLARLTRMLGDE